MTFKSFLLSTLLASMAWPAMAEQRLVADERSPLKANISKQALSRVAINGARIKTVKWLDGELEVDQDGQNGQVYVRGLTNKTTSLFVHSDEGKTYLLLLSPRNKTGDSIVIDVEGQRQTAREQAALVPPPPQPVTTRSSDYVRSIKQLMLGMMSGGAGTQGLRHQPAYETVPLWRGVQFVKTGQYTAADMLAEVYTLSNISPQAVVLREQEFYTPSVYAVSVRKQNLQPGESTQVYIVRRLGSGL